MGLVSDLKLSSASGILDNIVYSEQKRIFPVAFLTDKKNHKLECQKTQ